MCGHFTHMPQFFWKELWRVWTFHTHATVLCRSYMIKIIRSNPCFTVPQTSFWHKNRTMPFPFRWDQTRPTSANRPINKQTDSISLARHTKFSQFPAYACAQVPLYMCLSLWGVLWLGLKGREKDRGQQYYHILQLGRYIKLRKWLEIMC